MVIERLKEAVNLMRKDLIERRELNYEEGSIGITSLIYCPIKVELRQKYPDLKSESHAIDDGYIFENTFEPYIERVFGKDRGRVLKDADIPYELEGFKITGHPDFVIEMEDKVIILEFKAPIFFSSNKEIKIPEDEFIIDTDKNIKISESYILQTKIQKFITEKYFNKPVESYLFIKTTIQNKNKKMKKVLILRPVEDSISEEDMKQLITDFKEKKEPRYHWECNYCNFLKENLCQKGMLLKKQREL